MANCKVCGEQINGGVVAHTDCFNDMVAEIETLKKDREKAKQLFDEIVAISEKRVDNNG